jgi:hypothetical protein
MTTGTRVGREATIFILTDIVTPRKHPLVKPNRVSLFLFVYHTCLSFSSY